MKDLVDQEKIPSERIHLDLNKESMNEKSNGSSKEVNLMIELSNGSRKEDLQELSESSKKEIILEYSDGSK